MILGILVKSAVYFYVGLKGLEYVFRLPYRYFAVPISMIVAVFSILISNNFAELSQVRHYLRQISPPHAACYTICDYDHFNLENEKESAIRRRVNHEEKNSNYIK